MSPSAHLRSTSHRGLVRRQSRSRSSSRNLTLEALERRDLLATGLGTIPGLTDSRAARYVTTLYDDLLERIPLSSEVSGWVAQLQAGQRFEVVAWGILSSAEYRQHAIRDTHVRVLERTTG